MRSQGRGAMMRKGVHVSKLMALMLRHRPEEFGIEVDRFGFADLQAVLAALQARDASLAMADIESVVYEGEKPRFEIVDGRIRARYGHSFSIELGIDPSEPPEFLYKGIDPSEEQRVLSEGMAPFDRDYVHLSFDADVAAQLASRPGRRGSVIRIDARRAHEAGFHFYDCGPTILTKHIPAEYVALASSGGSSSDSVPSQPAGVASPPEGPVTYGRRRRFSSGR